MTLQDICDPFWEYEPYSLNNGPYSIIRFQITHTRAVNGGGGGGGGELAGGHIYGYLDHHFHFHFQCLLTLNP